MLGIEMEDNVIPRASLEKPRRSISLSLPSLAVVNGSIRKSFSYSKLPEEPIKLSVRKLDASSFDVEVIKSATISELKLAVQDVFCHMPQKGPGKISWSISSSTSSLESEQNDEEDCDYDNMENGRYHSLNDKNQTTIVLQECQFGHLWKGWSSYSRISTITRTRSSKDRGCDFLDNFRKIMQLWGSANCFQKRTWRED